MTRTVLRSVALTISAAAALTATFLAGMLTADAVAAQRALARHKLRVAELLPRVREDAAYAAELQAEYDRQRDETLARDGRDASRAWALLVAAGVFLAGAKTARALRSLPPTLPRQVVERHAMAGAGAKLAACAAPPAAAVSAAERVDVAAVDEIVARLGRTADAAIPILHALQDHYRHVPEAALRRVCEISEITPAQLAGVVSFYTQFRSRPVGRHVATVCHGTACHVAGAARISDELRRRLNIAPGEDTDAERRFTVREAPCLGCCTLAPVVQVDGTTHGHVQADTAYGLLEAAERPRAGGAKDGKVGTVRQDLTAETGRRALAAGEIRVGLGSCCVANGSGRVFEALHGALAEEALSVVVKRVGCVGMCHQTPLVEVLVPGRLPVFYARVAPEHVPSIVRRHFRPRGLARRIRAGWGRLIRYRRDVATRRETVRHAVELQDPPVAAFLGRQVHIATEHCGDLDPLDLDEYLAHDGFGALGRGREMSAEEVIEQIRRSGLRGRGGAGFPTWLKWERVRAAAMRTNGHGPPVKYLVCNGDEGDPGAFMDRMLMESYPYRVIEGVAIAAHATGATEGIFYIRAEYPLASERITEALRRCEDRGLLGDGLRLRVVHGAGAFVCGEETALIASLEGQRGMPTLRPPYPAESGLWGQPTLVNNVETFAVVPWIMRHEAAAFAAVGTPESKGTKVFALTGKIRRGGLIEVPMGITLREIVEDIGGGIREEATAAGARSRSFKAVQIGGPSGGCLPAVLADTRVDYEDLAAVGAIMGSGGLVVLDETDCMVDIARYFLGFTQHQSCGRCTPCRIGTRRMLEILERLCSGAGRAEDLTVLAELGAAVGQSSLCGLGKTAPNPVLTTLRYFRAEYEAHVAGRCPAGKCKALIRYEVTEACTGCTICAQYCPVGAIALRPYERHEIDAGKCTRCDACRIRCPEDAIRIV